MTNTPHLGDAVLAVIDGPADTPVHITLSQYVRRDGKLIERFELGTDDPDHPFMYLTTLGIELTATDRIKLVQANAAALNMSADEAQAAFNEVMEAPVMRLHEPQYHRHELCALAMSTYGMGVQELMAAQPDVVPELCEAYLAQKFNDMVAADRPEIPSTAEPAEESEPEPDHPMMGLPDLSVDDMLAILEGRYPSVNLTLHEQARVLQYLTVKVQTLFKGTDHLDLTYDQQLTLARECATGDRLRKVKTVGTQYSENDLYNLAHGVVSEAFTTPDAEHNVRETLRTLYDVAFHQPLDQMSVDELYTLMPRMEDFFPEQPKVSGSVKPVHMTDDPDDPRDRHDMNWSAGALNTVLVVHQ